MISTDRGALICDLAETYGIYDYRSLPAATVATLSAGLREDSRIKTKLRGGKAGTDTDVLLGHIHDRLVDILSSLGAYKKGKRPESMALKLMGAEDGGTKDNRNIRTFSSAEAFEKARNRILQKGM